MQRWNKACLAAGLAVVISAAAGPAMAQPEGGGRGRGGFGGGMFGGGGGPRVTVFSALQAEPVQKELALTEDQTTKLKALGDEVRAAMRELAPQGGFGRGEGERPSREEMEKRMTEFREKSDKLIAEKKGALAAIISAEQMTRLEQIVLQAKGGEALNDKELQAKLMISAEQQAKLASVSKEFGEKEREAMAGAFRRPQEGEDRRPDPAAFQAAREKVTAVQKEKDAALVAVLTDAQAEQFDALKGKAVADAELEAVRRGPGGGRGPGGFGGPGGGRGGDRPRRPATEN